MLTLKFRTLLFRPVARTLVLLLAMPPLSWLSQNSHDHSIGLFRAAAQTASNGCAASANQIIQAGCGSLILPQFEQAAVQGYLAQHGLPLTDAQYIYSYGGSELRNEIRAYMLDLLVSYAAVDISKLDDVQSNAYQWLQGLVQAEEKQYWAAAAAEYALWKASPCNYKLDSDVASAQGLSYDPTQWCYPSLASEFSTPEVPDQNYFLAVAWKKTYGSLLGNSTQNAILLTSVQQTASQYAALYALPASFTAASAAGSTVASNFSLLAPWLEDTLTASAGRGESATAAAADTVGEAATLAQEDIAAALETASEAVGGTVIGIVLFAIETAVQAGIDAVNTQNTLDQIATLPSQADQIAGNPPTLASMLATQDGYTKASAVFVNATLPDFPSTLNAVSVPSPSVFWVKETGASTSTLTYRDSSSKQNVAGLRGGWFINQGPSAASSQLVGTINYFDWSGHPRYATRVGPYQFLVYRPQHLSTDVDCPASAATGLSNAPNLDVCYSYATNSLKMQDVNGHNITVEAVNLRTLTSPSYASFSSGQPGSSTLTFSPAVNDVPCSLSASGLPTGLSLVADTVIEGILGSSVKQGVYNTPLTLTCGGSGGLSTAIPYQVIVGGSNLQFTSPSTFSGVLNYSVNFAITTTGFPIPKLTANLHMAGIRFTDNGNGTATISSDPTNFGGICIGPCPAATITADNGIQQITQTLNLTLNSQQVTFVSPAQGSTLQFPTGTSTSYLISTKGNFTGYPLTFSALPSWLTARNNGNGTGTISGAPPLGLEGSSFQIQITANLQRVNTPLQPSFSESFTASAVANPKPVLQVQSGTSLAFVAGVGQAAHILSNISTLNGIFAPTGPLPPGLSYQYIPCFANGCGAQAVIAGTPPVGSGGDYKVPFGLSNQTGTSTETLDIVIDEKPQLASANRIIFYAGQPASSTVSVTGFPLKPIGPFQDGIGYSGGATFSDPASTVPSFLKLTSGLGGTANGTATLASTATSSNLGHWPVSLLVVENAAPTPALTNPSQLSNFFNLDVYVVPPGDVNLDFKVDCLDLSAIKAGYGKVRGTPGYDSALDVNGDGVINVRDLAIVASKVPAGTRCTQ